MGAGASQHRPGALHLTPDTPGVVLSLQPYEHLTLTLTTLPAHQQHLAAASACGLYPSIVITAAIAKGGVSRLQLHLPLPPRPPPHLKPETAVPLQSTPPSLASDPLTFPPESRLIANSHPPVPCDVSLHLLAVDSFSFRPSSYPLSITNLDTPTLLTLTVECRIDHPIALSHDLRVLQVDHHRLAWELHEAQRHIQSLKAEIDSRHSSSSYPHTSHVLPSLPYSHPSPRSSSFNRTPLHFPQEEEKVSLLPLEDERVHQLLSVRQQRLLRSHLQAWRRIIQQRSRQRDEALVSLVYARDHLLLRTAFHLWTHHPRPHRQSQPPPSLIHPQIAHPPPVREQAVVYPGRVASLFHAWRGVVRERRHRLSMLTLSVAGKKELHRQWRVWKRWTAKVHRTKAEAARHHLLNRTPTPPLPVIVQSTSYSSGESPSATASPTAVPASALPLPRRSVSALVSRMMQGVVRSAFLAWRLTAQQNLRRRSRALTLHTDKQQRLITHRLFRQWKTVTSHIRHAKAQSSQAEVRKRAIPSLVENGERRSQRRLMERVWLHWKDGYIARREQKRDALRLLCNIRGKAETSAVWERWSSRAQRERDQGGEAQEELIATVVAQRTLPEVGMTRTLPASLPVVTPTQGGGKAGGESVREQYMRLQKLYGQLFRLVQSFRGEVLREWELNERAVSQHSTCRCDQCRMRAMSRTSAALQLVWVKRFDKEMEHFRFVQ